MALSLHKHNGNQYWLFHYVIESWPHDGQGILACCHKHGIEQAINLAVLSSEDLGVLCEGSSEATFILAAAAQAAASRLTEGWARGSSLRAERALSDAVRAPMPHRPYPHLYH